MARSLASGALAEDGRLDRVNCGAGADTSEVDPVDVVDPSCE